MLSQNLQYTSGRGSSMYLKAAISIFCFLGSDLLYAAEKTDINETFLHYSPLVLLLIVITLGIYVIVLKRQIKRYQKEQQEHQELIHNIRNETVEAERAKDTFLANVSHETRTPMTAIIGLSHILLQSGLEHSQKMNITKIKRSAEHLLAITNDILDYSKIEAGKLEINTNSFETTKLLNDLADMMGIQAVEKGLDLIFDISPKLPATLIGDPLRISQVLINLLNNAIKFTDFGSVILKIDVLKIEGHDYTLHFEVQDSGIGLTQEQQSRLFHAFDQADNKISRKYGGSGLGLTISQELIGKMGSTLNVNSTFREGSTFFFELTLPAADVPLTASTEHMKRILVNKSILILETNSYSAAMLANILSDYKAHTKTVSRIDEMYQLLRQQSYDAIFIDSRFLDSISDSLLINRQSDATVILNYEVHRERSVNNLRVDATITKPFIYQTVLHAIQELFDKEISVNIVGKEQMTLEDVQLLSGSRVLLAEDNEGNKMVVEGLLKESGIILTSVNNGQKAVEAVFGAEEPYELIIMDINMPVMDGYVATSIIREYQKYDNIPIIAMTANITQSDIEKSKSFGMQAHLSKPIDVNAFYQTLLKYIEPKIDQQKQDNLHNKRVEDKITYDLTTLPFVDITDGLARLNGNTQIYLDILYKFAEMFQGIDKAFQDILSKKEYSKGLALAHSLKGLAGNIGAKEIYALAQELEDAFKDNEGEFSALIDAIEHKRKPLVHAIMTIQKAQKKRETTEKLRIDDKKATELLSSLLHDAKKRKAIDVKKRCLEIEMYQWPDNMQERIENILKHAKTYQFNHVCDMIEEYMLNNSENGKEPHA